MLTFEEAADGQHALDLARLTRPDLVILDMMMPILDGLETCHRFKSDPVLQTILVLLVTAGQWLPPNSPTWQTIGADGLINKPFEDGALRAAVDTILRPGGD